MARELARFWNGYWCFRYLSKRKIAKRRPITPNPEKTTIKMIAVVFDVVAVPLEAELELKSEVVVVGRGVKVEDIAEDVDVTASGMEVVSI